MTKILISGGTGLVGNHLCKKLIDRGYSVAILSRASHQDAYMPIYAWDIDKKEIEKEAIESVDYIIHLAGENIGNEKWTTKRKQSIIDSRVKSTELLFEKIKRKKIKPKAFISASAIGYYGTVTSDKIFTETDPPANDFLGETCRLWEQSADNFEKLGIRTVKIRTGIVLTKQGGVLAKMTIPIKTGIGSAIGDGKQYMPWIHIDDLCGIYIKTIEDQQMKGTYNAVAPDHQTNRNFTKILAHVLKKSFWVPNVPAFALKIILGEMSEILLSGSRVSSQKIIKAGFKFKFPKLQTALMDLLNEK